MPNQSQIHEIKTDVAGLIRLLALHLYAQPDVFLREMIQNANDAIARREAIEGNNAPGGQIHLRVTRGKDEHSIVFEDNGAGMTEQEIADYLSTIGRSGTDDFRKELQTKGRYAESASLIGQFGIGLLSAFVVARHVTVQTRSCRVGSPGWRWECWGDKNYELTQDDSFLTPGSRVTLDIDDQHRDVLDLSFIRQAVRKYADFVRVPIHLNDEGRINTVDAPWHRTYASERERLEEYSIFVARRFPGMPLSIMPVEINDPYPVRGVLYISDRQRGDLAAPGRVDIYQSRMFIAADHPDMLPPWAKFVSGVIDSPALTPTAARDNVQQDAIARSVRDALGRVIINHLKKMANDNLRRFQEVMDWHHYHIKGMALEADDFFREVADLLPFETNEGPRSLRQYLEKAVQDRDGRRTILYFSERGQATQFFLLADAKGISVINASYVHESRFLEKYAREFPNIKLEQLDFAASDIIFQSLSPDEADLYQELLTEFNLNMPTAGSQARIVRFRPVNIPAVITLTEAQKLSRQLDALKDNLAIPDGIRDLVRRVSEERSGIPVTIYLNADNPTIQALPKMNFRTEVAVNAMIAIYNNALMLAQHLITPRNAEMMFTQFNRVIDLLISETRQTDALRQKVMQLELAARNERQSQTSTLTPHVSCFVAFDFQKRDAVFRALSDVLQDRPYFWQVVRADASVEKPDLLPNLTDKMRRAHCFIVELSDANPNVMLELGMMLTLNRPILLLRSQDSSVGNEQWANLSGKLYEIYDAFAAPEALNQQLAEILQRQTGFQSLRGSAQSKFLSPVLLRGADVKASAVDAVCREYVTVEEFVGAPQSAAASRVRVNSYIISALQEYARDRCGLKKE